MPCCSERLEYLVVVKRSFTTSHIETLQEVTVVLDIVLA